MTAPDHNADPVFQFLKHYAPSAGSGRTTLKSTRHDANSYHLKFYSI